MKIVIDPEELQRLADMFSLEANKLTEIDGKLHSLMSGLDWEIRQKSKIDNFISEIHDKSSIVFNDFMNLSNRLKHYANGFKVADNAGKLKSETQDSLNYKIYPGRGVKKWLGEFAENYKDAVQRASKNPLAWTRFISSAGGIACTIQTLLSRQYCPYLILKSTISEMNYDSALPWLKHMRKAGVALAAGFRLFEAGRDWIAGYRKYGGLTRKFWISATLTAFEKAAKFAADFGGMKAGFIVGVKVGALVGSICPGAGNVVGAAVGGIVGAATGWLISRAGEAAVGLIEKRHDQIVNWVDNRINNYSSNLFNRTEYSYSY